MDQRRKKVAVTAGASTPTQLVREVLLFLEQFDAADKTTWKREHNQDFERILPKTKNKYMAEKKTSTVSSLEKWWKLKTEQLP